MIAECAVRVRKSLIGCLDESAILDIELGVVYQVNVDVHRAGRLGLLLNLDGHPLAYSASAAMELVINGGPEVKKGKRKVQGVPQPQTAALPRPQEEEETDKSKQAQTEQTYEKH